MHGKQNYNSNEWMDQSIKFYQFGWMLCAGFLCVLRYWTSKTIMNLKSVLLYLTRSIKFHSNGDRELK